MGPRWSFLGPSRGAVAASRRPLGVTGGALGSPGRRLCRWRRSLDPFGGQASAAPCSARAPPALQFRPACSCGSGPWPTGEYGRGTLAGWWGSLGLVSAGWSGLGPGGRLAPPPSGAPAVLGFSRWPSRVSGCAVAACRSARAWRWTPLLRWDRFRRWYLRVRCAPGWSSGLLSVVALGGAPGSGSMGLGVGLPAVRWGGSARGALGPACASALCAPLMRPPLGWPVTPASRFAPWWIPNGDN